MYAIRSYYDEFKFHRSHPAKNADHDLEFAFVRLDVFHHAGKVQERTVDDTDRLTYFELDFRFRPFGPRITSYNVCYTKLLR